MGIGSLGIGGLALKNWYGSISGTMSYTKKSSGKTSPKKLKKLQYNFKEISSQLLRAKTSGNAKQVAAKARRKIGLLRQKLRIGEYDDKEVEDAILHALRMERVAKKRMKHLREEERVERGHREQEMDPEEKLAEGEEAYEELQEQNGPQFEDDYMDEESWAQLQINLQAMWQRMEELMQENMDQWMEEANPLQEELLELEPEKMSTEDFEQWKKKHRSEELRDIMEADLKYLKSVFNRLQREKEQLTSVGVSLELGGVEIPVEAAPMPPLAEGGSVDAQA